MPRAVRFARYGGPEVLEVVDVPELRPGPGELRIAVRAAGVNPFDAKVRRGAMAGGAAAPAEPQGLGHDVAGVVDAVGPDVSSFAIGDAVLGAASSPAYAEQALARPDDLVVRPPGVPWSLAGGLGVVARTAHRTLRLLEVGAGETLLVHGASGGVGSLASQLAVAAGARVIGTAGPRNHDRLRGWGVEPVTYGEGLEERVLALAPDGVDAVLDASGHGVIALSVRLAGGPDRVLTIADGDADAHGVRFSASDAEADMTGALAGITARVAAGELDVPVAATFPLEQAAEAHRRLDGGRADGKIVLLP